MIDTSVHPCFNLEAKHTQARVHLPIAPKCNVQCGYCNRKYDCVNESRPGVSSAVLSPVQALHYLHEVKTQIPNLSTVGIAGPGDPFANAPETLQTLELIRNHYPEMVLCLSSNGLEIEEHIDALVALQVSHVTLTINSIRPEILAQIYKWARFNKKIYRGMDAGEIMQQRQLSALEKLTKTNMIVKVNTVVVPGINDDLVEETALFVAGMGAHLYNAIPLLPTADTAFENLDAPGHKYMSQLKHQAGRHIKIMEHCERCRADAVGLLGQDNTDLQASLATFAQTTFADETKPYIAVASMEGYLVNQHLGEADSLLIYEKTENGPNLVEERKTPPGGLGDHRWLELARSLNDCSTILVSGIGNNPMQILQGNGVQVIETEGLVSELVGKIFNNQTIPQKSRSSFKCGSQCSGSGEGC
jgi:nitrogen fixation protein NifB